MSWVAVAVGGASLVGGYMNAKGAKDAAKASAGGSDRAAQVQWDMFNQARADNEPFRQAGLTGLQEYMALLGLPTSSVAQASTTSSIPTEWFGAGNIPTANPTLYASDPAYRAAWDQAVKEHQAGFGKGYTKDSSFDAIQNRLQQLYTPQTQTTTTGGTPGTSLTQQQAFDRFRSTPGYQFGLTEGVRALDSSAAAAGGLFSGKAAKALTKFGTDYADQQGYTPYKNSLAALAGIGQTATNQNNQLGMTTAGNVGAAYQNAGNARASGIQGSANAWGGALNGLAGAAGYAYGNRGGWGWGGI
jgi:hypothetical protein